MRLAIRLTVAISLSALTLACGPYTTPPISATESAPVSSPAPTKVPTLAPVSTPPPTFLPTIDAPAVGTRLFEGAAYHLLRPTAAAEARLAISRIIEGEYEAALGHLRKAKAFEGSPSSVLESYIGIVYGRMGRNVLAADYHSRAIAISDSISNRMNRAGAYRRNGQCDRTIADAQAVLGFQHVEQDDFRAAVQARLLLMDCYIVQEQDALALEHVVAAVKLAEKHGYSDAIPGDWNGTVVTLLAWSREEPSPTP